MNARLFFAACASAALLSAAACNNTSPNSTNQTKAAPDTAASAKGTSGTDEQPRPIALTGCLQKGDGSDYILTQINEPSAGAATSGDKVEREQVNAAEHSYRLNAKGSTNDDDWSKMVGRQVRVSGTLAKASDIDQKVGTSGSNDRIDTKDNRADNDRVKLHESDLAQVDVANIQQVAAECGGHAMKNGAKAAAKPRRK